MSQTFISNEFLALRRMGVRVRALSWYPARSGVLGADERALVSETLCVIRPGLLEGLADLCWCALHHPQETLQSLRLLLHGEAPPRQWAAFAAHLLYACHLVRHFDLEQVAVYHAHFATGPASVAMFLGVLTRKPYTVVAHAYDIYAAPVALGAKIRSAAAFVTVSEQNRRWLVERYGPVARRVRVIHCGVDTLALTRLADGALTQADPPLIISVGRLTPKKGHETLIRACGLLRDAGAAFTCLIVGDGEQRSRLAALVQRLGLDDMVCLAGALPHDRTLDLVARATVLVLACRELANGDRDGIPVALMEAMAMGVPVISTRVSGIPELVTHNRNGLLVDQGDHAALAEAIRTLLSDASRRRALGEQARRTVEQEFDQRSTANAMRLLLEAVAPRLKAPG